MLSSVDWKVYGMLIIPSIVIAALIGRWSRNDKSRQTFVAISLIIWVAGLMSGLRVANYQFDYPYPMRYEQGGMMPICPE